MVADSLAQFWPMPSAPRPIVLIGAGGIVNDAHLPAYRKHGFTVAGIYDLDPEIARQRAADWDIPAVFETLDQVADQTADQAGADLVFDLATPPGAHAEVLAALPDGATVLIQKPLGRTLQEASEIREVCAAKNLTAAVNFQLRFSPMGMLVRQLVEGGHLGAINELEVHLNLLTPWHLFPFLKGMDRVEIAVHSIHYFDFIRSLLGDPAGIWAQSLGHPAVPDLAQTRTSAIFDYGAATRCCLSVNHNHERGEQFQDASIRIEGDRGSVVMRLGLLLNYPEGKPDELWVHLGDGWQSVALEGGWFPDAFRGTMANLQRFAAGEDEVLHTAATDAWHTMALVEAAYRSSEVGATPVPRPDAG
jgi:predicted dehydrogenase